MNLYAQLNSFFQENKLSLLENYPGLTFERIWQEWELGPHFGYREESELRKSCYVSGLTPFCDQLLQGIPLAYISGQTFFYNSWFRIGSDVLIPRFETELLVEMALHWAHALRIHSPLHIVDVGTGSGAILLSFLKELRGPSKALGVDISNRALKWAMINDRLTGFCRNPKSEIRWQQGDRLEGIDQQFDLILSNPPYIPKSMQGEVHPQVDQFEPPLALYIEDGDYLHWYHHFFTQCLACLSPQGAVFLEGEESWLPRLQKLALEVGFQSAILVKDLQQRWRFLKLLPSKNLNKG